MAKQSHLFINDKFFLIHNNNIFNITSCFLFLGGNGFVFGLEEQRRAVRTHGFPFALFEEPIGQRTLTVAAYEVLRVPFFAYCLQKCSRYQLATAATTFACS